MIKIDESQIEEQKLMTSSEMKPEAQAYCSKKQKNFKFSLLILSSSMRLYQIYFTINLKIKQDE